MEHRTRTVSHVGKCRIEHCTCGTVHMSVGGTTIRVNASTASDLHSALATLVAELGRAADTPVGQSRSRRADASVHEHAPGPSTEDEQPSSANDDNRLPTKGKPIIH